MRQTLGPLLPEGPDLGRRERCTDFLQPLGIGAPANAVVQRLEGNAFLGQLSLDVFVAVEAQLGVAWKVRTELDEEGAEVLIHAVEVVMVEDRKSTRLNSSH